MRHIPDSLLLALDQICTQVELGHTFSESLKNQKEILVSPSLAREWLQVRERILNGQSDMSLLFYFSERIRAEHHVTSKIKQAIFLSQSQAYTLSALALLLIIWHPLSRPPLMILSLCFCLILLGTWILMKTTGWVLQRFPLLDWNDFLQTLQSGLRCGQTPRQCLLECLKKIGGYEYLNRSFKTHLFKNLSAFLEYDSSRSENKNYQVRGEKRQKQILEMQYESLQGSLWSGEPLLKTLEKFVHLNQKIIDSEMHKLAQLMSLVGLLPLLLFHLPAILLLLFTPILELF
jgi:hypothetical protein